MEFWIWFIVTMKNQYFIRCFYQNDQEVILVPENFKYDIIFIDIKDLDIVGIVKSFSYSFN